MRHRPRWLFGWLNYQACWVYLRRSMLRRLKSLRTGRRVWDV